MGMSCMTLSIFLSVRGHTFSNQESISYRNCSLQDGLTAEETAANKEPDESERMQVKLLSSIFPFSFNLPFDLHLINDYTR